MNMFYININWIIIFCITYAGSSYCILYYTNTKLFKYASIKQVLRVISYKQKNKFSITNYK